MTSFAAPRMLPASTCDSESQDVAEFIAACAVRSLLQELTTWPKPGLVSHIDKGSHTDMDAATLRASAAALGPFFLELTLAGQKWAAMSHLRSIGMRAEAAMLAATGGVNTHRGAIFGLGLLCAAAGATARMSASGRTLAPLRLGAVVAQRWGDDIRQGPIPLFSHGSSALRRYGAGGARAEAAGGFPSVYGIGLPALRKARSIAPNDAEAARVQACFALISIVEDTNLLHRGGAGGARYAAEAASAFLLNGGIAATGWRSTAARIHDSFVARRLSPGGCADLLAMALFIDALEI